MGILMRYCGTLFIFLIAFIVAVSGCIEFGENSYTPATATPTSGPSSYAIPGAQVPSSQITVTLSKVDYDRTANMTQAENITLTLKNTGTTDVSNVGISVKAKDTPTGTALYSGTAPAGNIKAGKEATVSVQLPPHAFVNTMTLSVNVYWGRDPAYVNDETRPWVISLATNPYW
ncbi:hypothetical protein [Methanocella sp. MCL-LM]|uniref:hypothetical protein n=1 Tax=Methanocella sp. MCL-LM TaxID=3412035 RepID=UPI003C786F81